MSSLKRTNDSEASKNPQKKRPVTRQSHARMATTQEAEPASKEVIDPDGDLILVLPNAELQVSSKFLCMTSKVFKAMLSTRFAEGTADLVGGIRRINLPGQFHTPCYSLLAYDSDSLYIAATHQSLPSQRFL